MDVNGKGNYVSLHTGGLYCLSSENKGADQPLISHMQIVSFLRMRLIYGSACNYPKLIKMKTYP